MKFVKISMLALAMGLFVASCGDGTNENETVDTMATEPMPPMDTMNTTPPPVMDTTVAPAADSPTVK